MVAFFYRFLVVVLGTYAGSSLLAPLRLLGWDIDLGLLALFLVSVHTSRAATIAWGAFSGFLIDCLNPQWMGAGIASRATVALFVGSMREKLNIEHTFLDGVAIFVAGIIDRTLYLALTQYRKHFFFALWRYILPSAAYTALVGVVIILLYRLREVLKPRLAP